MSCASFAPLDLAPEPGARPLLPLHRLGLHSLLLFLLALLVKPNPRAGSALLLRVGAAELLVCGSCFARNIWLRVERQRCSRDLKGGAYQKSGPKHQHDRLAHRSL